MSNLNKLPKVQPRPVNPEAAEKVELIRQMDIRQDELLQQLDELNARIENIIDLFSRNRAAGLQADESNAVAREAA